MRLINTTTFKLEGPFFGDGRPQYAILSHTWGAEELCLQDMAYVSSHTHKKGFDKIENSCARAAHDGYTYIWIDTVCIDKTSSAELSEAINSMYDWYANAGVCYAFLEDLPAGVFPEHLHSKGADWVRDIPMEGSSHLILELSRCRWFTRGWTLQELVAPRTVLFFDKKWGRVGEKFTLRKELSTITGIDSKTLWGSSPRM